MPRLSKKGEHFFRAHGWSDKDIVYIKKKATKFEEDPRWIMAVSVAEDGVIWLFPTSPGNVFPVSLWKKIKEYITNNDNVIIPMNENLDLVSKAAKRYNGYLQDNLYMFGDELKGLQYNKGKI